MVYPKRRPRSEETKRKVSDALKRENNPNWKGGIAPAAVRFKNSREGRRWRKQVLERDDRTCRRWGKKNCKLAHHIGAIEDYPKVAYEISNGLTVCCSCHRLVHIYAKAGAFDLLIIPETDHPVWRF